MKYKYNTTETKLSQLSRLLQQLMRSLLQGKHGCIHVGWDLIAVPAKLVDIIPLKRGYSLVKMLILVRKLKYYGL